MGLGVTLTVVQAGTVLTNIPVEQVYHSATANNIATIIVSMSVPNLQGATATPSGPYIIDSFKVALRHQNRLAGSRTRA